MSTIMAHESHEETTSPAKPDLRANQKHRTRMAVVAAATEMLRRGQSPTVAEAAELAMVSRTTAYRYFPTQDALLVEVAQVNPAADPVDRWLEGLQETDPALRLQGLVRTFNRVAFSEEVAFRTGLRAYLDTWLESKRRGEAPTSVREGRRTRWLDEALEPVRKRLTPARWKRLRAALALTVGPEAVIVMKDVCNASDQEAMAVLDWTSQAILRAALQEARPPD